MTIDNNVINWISDWFSELLELHRQIDGTIYIINNISRHGHNVIFSATNTIITIYLKLSPTTLTLSSV